MTDHPPPEKMPALGEWPRREQISQKLRDEMDEWVKLDDSYPDWSDKDKAYLKGMYHLAIKRLATAEIQARVGALRDTAGEMPRPVSQRGTLEFDGGNVRFNKEGHAEFTIYESYISIVPLEERSGSCLKVTIDRTEIVDLARFLNPCPRKICEASGCLNTAPAASAFCNDHQPPQPAAGMVTEEMEREWDEMTKPLTPEEDAELSRMVKSFTIQKSETAMPDMTEQAIIDTIYPILFVEYRGDDDQHLDKPRVGGLPEAAAAILALLKTRAPALEREALVVGEPVTLRKCPIGLFMAISGELCLKTEYGNNEGRIDAFIVSSGEWFWGAPPQTIRSQNAELVRPVSADALLAFIAAHIKGGSGG